MQVAKELGLYYHKDRPNITKYILLHLPRSNSLNAAEHNYSISELKTLAIAWVISHFHAYLYGQQVTVLTDHMHAAVKPMLETLNLSGKHAR